MNALPDSRAMTLADFTRERMCVTDLRGRDPPDILLELSLALECGGVVRDSLWFFNDAMHRYFLADADVFPGVAACPVGRLEPMAAPAFALGRASEPIHWRHDCAPVRLIFLLAAPNGISSGYAALLLGLKRLARDGQVLAAIHTAADPVAMLGALQSLAVGETEPSSRVTAPAEL